MNVVLAIVMALGLLANVVGALCVIVPCLTVAVAVSGAVVNADRDVTGK